MINYSKLFISFAATEDKQPSKIGRGKLSFLWHFYNLFDIL